jgi:hypothetical protein
MTCDLSVNPENNFLSQFKTKIKVKLSVADVMKTVRTKPINSLTLKGKAALV